jgi:tRNA pseudouridine38-40 synthase
MPTPELLHNLDEANNGELFSAAQGDAAQGDGELGDAEPRRYRFGILLKLAYDGEDFSGLAIQSNARTVAGELLRAIRTMDPSASSLRVCSRTDAGVHARGQFVAFDANQGISSRGWLLGLSGLLPKQIAVLSVGNVRPGFQPSNKAIRKTYTYSVLQGTLRDPFLEGRVWRVSERLNHTLMRQEAATLLGTHDFRAFRGSADFRTNTSRTIERLELTPRPAQPRVLVISVTGNAFLYHMVRIIAGTLVDVGRGRLEPGAGRRALASGDRLQLGMTAPSAGLCLEHVELSESASNEWPYHLDGAPIDMNERSVD